MKNLIAFTGSMGSGKTTAANITQELLLDIYKQQCVIKFAEPIYDIVGAIKAKVGDRSADKERELMQFIGNWARAKDPNAWVNIWKRKVAGFYAAYPEGLVIVDDLRFDNEAKILKETGALVIKIDAPQEERAKRIPLRNTDDASEAGVSDAYIDFVIANTGNEEQLKAMLKATFDYYATLS